jgi:hypothetical protein
MNAGDAFNPWRQFSGAMVPNWLLRRPEVTLGAKLAYARLCQYAGENGECWPSQPTLARELGAGERSCRRWVAELEERKLIAAEELPGVGTRFRFLWHEWIDAAEGAGAAEGTPANLAGVEDGTPANLAAHPGQNGRPPRPIWPPTPANLAGKEIHEETQEKTQEETPPSAACAGARPAAEETPENRARRLINTQESTLFQFFNGLPSRADREELRAQTAALFGMGREVTPAHLSQAAEAAAAWCQQEGRRPTVGAFVTALKDAVNPLTPSKEHPNGSTGKPRPGRVERTVADKYGDLSRELRERLGAGHGG